MLFKYKMDYCNSLSSFIDYHNSPALSTGYKIFFISGDARSQLHNLSNRLLAGHEYFILRIRLIPSGINLVMVHIYGLPAGKNISQLRLFQGLDVIVLHADASLTVLLQNDLTAGQIINLVIILVTLTKICAD